ncbi:MAG TPA: ankyrin repeat domain-containing protein [Rhodanobacteraceae bacterium]
MSAIWDRLRFATRAPIFVVLMCAPIACEAISHNGETVAETFPNTKTAALVRAAESGNVEKMQALVQEGANVNDAGKQGVTPLVWVMTDHDYAGVEALLKLGADPNKKIANHNSPMWLAAGRDDRKMLALMLKYHGDPNIIGTGYASALEIAVRQFYVHNVDLLVKNGADINLVDPAGDTAATSAASVGHFDILAHLLELGYSHNLQDLAGWVEASKVNAHEQPNKDRVITMLRARGVQYPVQRRHGHSQS